MPYDAVITKVMLGTHIPVHQIYSYNCRSYATAEEHSVSLDSVFTSPTRMPWIPQGISDYSIYKLLGY